MQNDSKNNAIRHEPNKEEWEALVEYSTKTKLYNDMQMDCIKETEIDDFHLPLVIDAGKLFVANRNIEVNADILEEFSKVKPDTQNAFLKINSLTAKLAVELRKLDRDKNMTLYLSPQQVRGLIYLSEVIKELQTYPLPKLVNKRGDKGDLALQNFIKQLNDIFTNAFPNFKIELPHKNTVRHYYYGKYFDFMCACILPLDKTHPTAQELGHYLSNRLP